MGIIHKICDDIVDRSQNDCILLPPLKLVDGVHLISISQLLADGCHLIPIWRDNTDALEILLMQPRKHLLLDDIDLALVEMPTGVITGNRPVHGQYIRLIMILRHNDQLPVVELLVAEVDDFWVAAVVFPQQRSRCVLPYFQRRGQQAVRRKAIPLIQGILLPNGIAGANVILRQHIRELLQVPNNHDIPCTGEGQYPGSQINLRGLIHNQVIIDMFNAQRSLDGIGRAKYHRVLTGKLRRISAEIILFKAPSIIPPMIPCCQLRPKQPQGLLCELIHLRVESVALQLSVQFLLFGLQFPPLYEIELVLQIGNDLFRGADKQFERITVESEHDRYFLQQAQASLTLCMLFKFHPKRKKLLRGQLVQALHWHVTVTCVIFLKIMLLRV